MKIREIMVQPVTVVREDTTLEDVARTMLEERIGAVPVVDASGLISGIITESDFAAKEKGIPFSTFRAPQVFGEWLGKEGAERLYAQARTLAAKDIMQTRVITLTEEDTLETALEKMLHHDIKRLPVVRDGIPVGMVARHDLLKLMLPKREREG